MLKFEVYTVEKDSEREFGPKKGDIRVKFPEYGDDHCVEQDKNGELYFSVINILNNPEDPLNRLFIGRIKDAYDMVANGDGDAIQVSQLFGLNTISVIKFVNFDYGKEMRAKFLDGWKDTQFGWGVEAGNGNSFDGFSAVCENMMPYNRYMSPAENGAKYFFRTEKEAQDKMDEILTLCKGYSEQYKQAKSQGEQRAVLDNLVSEYGMCNVFLNYLISKENAETSEKEYQFRVVQMVW